MVSKDSAVLPENFPEGCSLEEATITWLVYFRGRGRTDKVKHELVPFWAFRNVIGHDRTKILNNLNRSFF